MITTSGNNNPNTIKSFYYDQNDFDCDADNFLLQGWADSADPRKRGFTIKQVIALMKYDDDDDDDDYDDEYYDDYDDYDDDDDDDDDRDVHVDLLGHDPSSTSDKVLPCMRHHTPRLKG